MDSKFKVDNSFWDIFPEASISVLTIKGIDNKVPSAVIARTQELLNSSTIKSEKHLTEDTFSSNAIIQDWRKAFTKFKKKKGARSSIEALLKRVSQGQKFNSINPLVDIYNSISLEYGVPCGGEDLNKISDIMHLGTANGGEAFRPLGSDKDDPALPGEVIYYDNEGAICRSFNWREAQRTMLTENTTDAIMVIEAINEEQQIISEKAILELKYRIQNILGIEGQIEVFTKPQK
ncbi:hypothetical protein LL14B4_06360 [Lactococcus lactis subsp. lactis]|uniref:B3/B4 tRNA-binding domain-containing protein n=1 Tax=Lactococcus lactis subsp. lactis TaxID=1360 RepID=A0A2Z3KEE1_LACLL|nr:MULTISPECIES: phenylalanine--tRNA ligase beta subunit-related protein [Lactococcus]AWN65817.1 hypothetical protein LL14B4_06360 [Lactococcus lactis subsp. lactis]MBK0028756.1 hypothetical protein [Lactococcus sp. S47]WFB96731.1 phenylalanine--tRNA ligase beta subunit-related protein [Lactococcus lactis]